MELHHLAMIALIAVAVVGAKLGRAVSTRQYQRAMQKEGRRFQARKCAREVARVERRGDYLDLNSPVDESPTVVVLRALRENKIAAADAVAAHR